METGNNGVGSKWKRGIERKRVADSVSQRGSIGESRKWRGLRNDRRKEHPRISNQ
jgi:hypothetical protein